ncbi:hypothetical protein AZH53_03885 [Methanomicrobiaceae archaeon CYW5]|uniref:hypothetical protein n=1 Tax=Methanovulcanius yangii TaxID=1789227 RepID=UPI0029C9E367|nr:hypothetical protein [Methanovulcanius yangii]MBT8507560.1 hypothetical protein [Methanovulcanius yangii]
MAKYILFIFVIVISFGACCINMQDTNAQTNISAQIPSNKNVSLNDTHVSEEGLYVSSDTKSYLDEIGTDEQTIYNIALKDGRVASILKNGGEIIGVFISCPPGPKDDPYPGCFPALRIRYEMTTVDFLVDVNTDKVVKTVSEVSSGLNTSTL